MEKEYAGEIITWRGGSDLWGGSYMVADSPRSSYLFILKYTVYVEDPCIYTFENAGPFAGWEAEHDFSRPLHSAVSCLA